ncbi:putative PGG domain-containing protein [Medicago truncatula]|uniref:Putative PGG domain-containing protein n=1 Tax=Medicago truncatula TaxID=3880 RepID=A0A396GIE4_MEDTR|nr:uncharacterized protein LOC11425534 [Medicago truncatula]RHN39384.1 putative PGG domain-containing protein [Medicago truncatula]
MNNQVDNHGGSTETLTNKKQEKGWRRVFKLAVRWLSYKNKNDWLEKMRGNFSVVAIFIATITFQMGLNPPGGVRPAEYGKDKMDDDILGAENSTSTLRAGEAAMAVVSPENYSKFLYSNTICFIASLSVLLLLTSGIRLSHRFTMWLVSIGMCFTLTSLLVTYDIAVGMITPDILWDDTLDFLSTLLYIWMGLFSFSGLLLTLRIIIWGISDFLNKREGKKANRTPTKTPTP